MQEADFFVPVIDNYWDAWFACSLALALLGRRADLRIRIVASDPALVSRLVGRLPDRLACLSFDDFFASGRPPSERFATFFGYRFPDGYLARFPAPRRELRFDYLQFDAWYRRHGGVASIHGTRFHDPESGADIACCTPSWVAGGGGVVLPDVIGGGRLEAIRSLPLDDGIREALVRNADWRWISVFCYPATAGIIREAIARVGEPLLVLWHADVPTGRDDAHLHVRMPFVPLDAYARLLGVTDANIARGENSLVASAALGRPTLWDPYRERNGAHTEKVGDFARNLSDATDDPAAGRYADICARFAGDDGTVRIAAAEEFLRDPDAFAAMFRAFGAHVRRTADIVPPVLAWFDGA